MCFWHKKMSRTPIVYSLPAKDITNALPSGNSHTAIFVLGGVSVEQILVQTDTFLLPKSDRKNLISNMLNTKENLSTIKRNLSKSNNKTAEKVLTNALLSKGFEEDFNTHFPLCRLILNFPQKNLPSNYSRALDLDSGVCSLSFETTEGVEKRESFVSTDGIICHKVEREKSFCGEITISPASDNQVLPFEKTLSIEKNYIIFYYKTNGVYFGIVCFIFAEDGKILPSDSFVKVKDATSLYIFAKTFSKVSNLNDEVEKIKNEINLSTKSFDKMKKEKGKFLSEKIQKLSIILTKDKLYPIENELLFLQQNEISLPLLQKLYDYGKYLSLSLGALAIKADSLFETKPNEKSPFDFENKDENMLISSENYLKLFRLLSFSLQCGDYESVKTYLMSIFAKLDDYKTNAQYLFSCDGIFIPSVEGGDDGIVGSSSYDILHNKNVMPFVFSLVCDYYTKTHDAEFMKTYGYEIAKNIGLFYLSFLKLNKISQMLESPFGLSPFSKPYGKEFMLVPNATVDFESARYIFASLSTLSKEFEDEKTSQKYLDALDLIPAVQVDKDGLIKEYSTGLYESDNSSPYIPHLFPYNIGRRMINAKRDYDLLVSNSIKSRYLGSFGKLTARDLSDMALALSTCGEGGDSFYVLNILCKFFLKDNLLFSQIDNSNFGVGHLCQRDFVNIDLNTSICAILQNMFVTNANENIYLFRTLSKRFGKVNIRGINITNNLVLSMQINNKKGVAKLHFLPQSDQKINLFLPSTYRKHKGEGTLDRQDLALKNILLQKGKRLKLKIYY